MKLLLTYILLCLTGYLQAQYSWQLQNSGTAADLKGIYFIDADNGWAVGNGGTILHTSNSGTSWTSQNSGTTNDLTYVWFIDNSKGFALGYSAFLKTTNGGVTWNSASAPFTGGTGMWFTSSLIGHIKTSSDMYMTTNGGDTWTISSTGVYTQPGNIHFSDAQNGWTVCPGVYTADGGNSWQSGSIPAMCDAMRWVWFTSSSTGYVVDGSVDGTDGGGTFWKTTNNGLSWTQKQTGLTSYLNCIRFSSSSQGWICGWGGAIASTSDAGETWTTYNPLASHDLNQIFFLDANTGWFTGNNGTIIFCKAQPEICLITVDGASQKNKLYWDAQTNFGISSWNVYRETTSGNYSLIGNVPYTNSPSYTDASSQPSVQSNRYKLTFVNASASESARSPYHQTMNLSITQGVPSTTMTLMWSRYEDESGEFVPDYYYIYRGTSPVAMQLHDSVSGAFNMYNDLNVTGIYYYKIEIEKICSGVLRGGSNNGNNDFNGIFSPVEKLRPAVYPNPASSQIVLMSPFAEEQEYDLYLIDITGRPFTSYLNVKGNFSCDVLALPPGLWILECRGDNTYRTFFVKE